MSGPEEELVKLRAEKRELERELLAFCRGLDPYGLSKPEGGP